MKPKAISAALSLVIFCSAGCDWRGIRGNGKIKTESRTVTAFTLLEAGGFYDLEWQPGAPSLRITTDENLLPKIETEVRDNVLKIRTHDQIAPTDGIKIVITSESLGGARLSGAVKFAASQLSGDRFGLETSGASKVTLAGKVIRLLASLTGASRLSAERLLAQDVEISVTGAGRADIFASNSVQAAITGAGKVTYEGNPKTVNKKVTGAGKISAR